MMSFPSSGKNFTVRRQKPELIPPSRPTPHETKPLSDIDDQLGLRFYIHQLNFYPNKGGNDQKDPVEVIKAALADVLVHFYPLAGRLREGPGRKLSVDCNEEGVRFVEADADVTLEELGEDLQPPFPYLEEVLHNANPIPGSDEFLNSPMVFVQVTRLRCGGFIFAAGHNHAVADGLGIIQFAKAMGEIASGASAPSIQPVWMRELLYARNPPRITCVHREYDEVIPTTEQNNKIKTPEEMVNTSLVFGPEEISDLRANSLPADFRQKCSTFDLMTASIWRGRIAALQMNPEEEVKVVCIVNARHRFDPPLPEGYYGNAVAAPVAITTAGELVKNPLEYAVTLLRKAKSEVTEEYIKSTADLMVLRGRPILNMSSTHLVSDVTRVGFDDIDFGWGRPTYAGPARAASEMVPGVPTTFYVPKHNKNGERIGTVAPVCLPASAMDRFIIEIARLMGRRPLIR
ncbi:OLC1v1021214C1 [Oldenlandia corymbosa var. corymbosa]|uniref:OLC1v1021214C1 n=1 Tax=Oldenlandia corymbosa var. corymbosa TaxID=529605 RepID=A0AAV1BVG0_OLDCO|nr:OLC1v1021214C1 [Oldenlandia corymbosa var. corymbosa]